VLGDVALLRGAAQRQAGTVADGTARPPAACTAAAPVEACKSLWSAFVSRPGFRTRAIGAVGYGAGVMGRVLVARRTGGRAGPDALTHPASVTAFAGLTALSWRRHDAGALTWKGRTLP
jgi:hypothetical protein